MTRVIDFETYSEIDLTQVGAHRYAEHPSTDIVCMSWEDERGEPQLWTPDDPFPEDLKKAVLAGDLLDAHNATFERMIWRHVGQRRYNFPPVFDNQWRDTMAVAGYRGMPLALDRLAKAARLPFQKDMKANKTMKRIAKPHRDTGHRITMDDDPAAYFVTYDYCVQDNVTERAASQWLKQLPPAELATWQLDQKINDRGFKVDVDLCEAAVDTADRQVKKFVRELIVVTDGAVTAPGQVAAIMEWSAGQGFPLDNLQADYLRSVRRKAPEQVRLVIDTRLAAARAAVGKYRTALACAGNDGRARGQVQYYGSHTGRWAGRLVQPQNMLKYPVEDDDVPMDDLVAAIKTRDIDFIEAVTGVPLMEALGNGVRGMVEAEEDHYFACGDYAGIEAVVLSCLAGETWKIEAFERGAAIYEETASKIFGYEVNKKDHPKERGIGKICELAFGYQGAVGAWRGFDDSDDYTDEEVKEFNKLWRDRHPRTRDMWKGVETAAVNAVRYIGETFTFQGPGVPDEQAIKFKVLGPFLLCKIPGGRLLHYYLPHLREAKMPWEDKNGDPVYRVALHYWGVKDGVYKRIKTYGGSLVENIVQAVSRDRLVHSMHLLERSHYPIVLTVHDEVLCELMNIVKMDAERFASIMAIAPDWCATWPIKAEAWIDRRYHK
jgi:DNA polymerase